MKIKSVILSVKLFLIVFIVSAQSVSDTIHLEEVTIKSRRINPSPEELLKAFQILDKTILSAAIDNDISTALGNAAAVDIRQRSFSNVQSDLSIRGGNFDQNVVLINGINLSDVQTGHHSLNIPIVNSTLKGIEVAYGPSSGVFTPNALTGAINLITITPDKNFADISLVAGSFNTINSDITAGLKNKNSTHLLNISHSRSDGFVENTDYYRSSAYYEHNNRIKSVDIKTMAGFINKGFGAQSFYTPAFPNQYEEINSGFAAIKAESGEKIRWSSQIYYRQHRDRFELFREHPNYYIRTDSLWYNPHMGDTVLWYKNHNYHTTHTSGAGIKADKDWKNSKTSIGTDYRSEIIFSTNLGEDSHYLLNHNILRKSAYRNNFSAFIDHFYHKDKFIINCGVMSYYNKQYGLNFYYGANAGYLVGSKTIIKTGINKTMRLPTFTDLYYVGPSNLGNSELKPENAINFETGIAFNDINKYSLSFDMFYRQGNDIIAWVKEPGNTKWKTENLTKLNTFGIVMAGHYSNFDSGFPINSIRASYMFIEQDKSNSGLESKYSLDHLRHKAILNIDHKLFRNLSGFLSLNLFRRNGKYEYFDRNIMSYTEEIDYQAFFLINYGLNIDFNKLSVNLKAANITNRDYFDIANVPTPGITIMAGIKYSFF